MYNSYKQCGIFVAVMIIWSASAAFAGETDKFMGDYEGTWGQGHQSALVAQVIPRGGGAYDINILPEFDQRVAPVANISGKAEGGVLRVDQDGWSGEIKDGVFSGKGARGENSVEFTMKHVTRLSPNLGAKPPAGALVLFDGSNFDEWEMYPDGGKVIWEIDGDIMRVVPVEEKPHPMLATRRAFKDYHLHLEFRLPLVAEATGQARSNSGVIFEDYHFYELQILDSYGLPSYYDDCGGIYKVGAPKINMCAPPLQWQSYDIDFKAARYNKAGKRVANARITVNHNGKEIHHDLELPFSEAAERMRQNNPESRVVGRIRLQDHGHPIEFRNIWIEEK